MAQDNDFSIAVNAGGIFSIVLAWLFIVILASVAGMDSCACGNGPRVRKQVQTLIHGDCKPCKSRKATSSTQRQR